MTIRKGWELLGRRCGAISVTCLALAVALGTVTAGVLHKKYDMKERPKATLAIHPKQAGKGLLDCDTETFLDIDTIQYIQCNGHSAVGCASPGNCKGGLYHTHHDKAQADILWWISEEDWNLPGTWWLTVSWSTDGENWGPPQAGQIMSCSGDAGSYGIKDAPHTTHEEYPCGGMMTLKKWDYNDCQCPEKLWCRVVLSRLQGTTLTDYDTIEDWCPHSDVHSIPCGDTWCSECPVCP